MQWRIHKSEKEYALFVQNGKQYEFIVKLYENSFYARDVAQKV